MKPVSRSAACIWLLSIVKHAGKHSTIQSKLPVIQQVFSYLLSDNNGNDFCVTRFLMMGVEVTQEVASRGLVFVYDYGDAAMKVENSKKFPHKFP
jgi:proteasome component ECM29